MLARAMSRSWQIRFPSDTVVFLSGADFARNVALAVETNAIDEFRGKHLNADLLIIDDLDELVDKPEAQSWLQRIHDARVHQDRRLLVTTRQILLDLPKFSSSLASRLWAGLTIPLELPEFETRKAIIQAIALAHEFQLSNSVVDLLADGDSLRCYPLNTVPLINHALLQMKHIAASSEVRIDESFVRQFLDGHRKQRTPSISEITMAVSRQFGLQVADLRSQSRRQSIVHARGVSMYLARQLTENSLAKIGQYFDGRDHTTVLHACRQIESKIGSDPVLEIAVQSLRQHFEF